MKKLLLIILILFTTQCYGATTIATMMQNNFDSPTVSDISYPRDWIFQYDAAHNVPTISTTVSKFGAGSLFCDANGSVIDDFTFPYYTKGTGLGSPNPLGTGDWTIEFWVYIKQRAPIAGNPTVFVPIYRDRNAFQSSGGTPFSKGFQIYTNVNDGGAGNPVLVMNGLYISTSYVATPIVDTINVTVSQPYNTWHHVAITKQFTATGLSTIRFFWNGSLYGYIYNIQNAYPITSYNDPTYWQQFGGQFGGYYDPPATYDYAQCPMYIDEYRLSRGCRYTWHFTPPTTPFEYPLEPNLNFKEDGKLIMKEDSKVIMKFSGGF